MKIACIQERSFLDSFLTWFYNDAAGLGVCRMARLQKDLSTP